MSSGLAVRDQKVCWGVLRVALKSICSTKDKQHNKTNEEKKEHRTPRRTRPKNKHDSFSPPYAFPFRSSSGITRTQMGCAVIYLCCCRHTAIWPMDHRASSESGYALLEKPSVSY